VANVIGSRECSGGKSEQISNESTKHDPENNNNFKNTKNERGAEQLSAGE